MRSRKHAAVRHVPVVVLFALMILVRELDAQSSRRRARTRNFPRLGGSLPDHLQQAYNSALNSNANANSQSQSAEPDAATQAPHGGQSGGDRPQQPDELFPAGDPHREWSSLAPTVPAPADVECLVEVQVTQIKGGRCTRLAGRHRPYICQSGQHFSFAPQCEARMNQRVARTQEAQTEG